MCGALVIVLREKQYTIISETRDRMLYFYKKRTVLKPLKSSGKINGVANGIFLLVVLVIKVLHF